MGIKFPDVKQPGVSLRSYKMKLPQSVGLRKLKAIESVLDELQIEPRPIATEAVCEQFNELRSDIVLLYELHQALSSCEYELQTLRHRYESVLVAKVSRSLFRHCFKPMSSQFIVLIMRRISTWLSSRCRRMRRRWWTRSCRRITRRRNASRRYSIRWRGRRPLRRVWVKRVRWRDDARLRWIRLTL